MILLIIRHLVRPRDAVECGVESGGKRLVLRPPIPQHFGWRNREIDECIFKRQKRHNERSLLRAPLELWVLPRQSLGFGRLSTNSSISRRNATKMLIIQSLSFCPEGSPSLSSLSGLSGAIQSGRRRFRPIRWLDQGRMVEECMCFSPTAAVHGARQLLHRSSNKRA